MPLDYVFMGYCNIIVYQIFTIHSCGCLGFPCIVVYYLRISYTVHTNFFIVFFNLASFLTFNYISIQINNSNFTWLQSNKSNDNSMSLALGLEPNTLDVRFWLSHKFLLITVNIYINHINLFPSCYFWILYQIVFLMASNYVIAEGTQTIILQSH